MKKLTPEEFAARLAAVPEVEPDEIDRAMLAAIDADRDETTIALDEIHARREFSGKIAIRVPRELHRELMEKAKENGVSLNQYIVYKLAK